MRWTKPSTFRIKFQQPLRHIDIRLKIDLRLYECPLQRLGVDTVPRSDLDKGQQTRQVSGKIADVVGEYWPRSLIKRGLSGGGWCWRSFREPDRPTNREVPHCLAPEVTVEFINRAHLADRVGQRAKQAFDHRSPLIL